MEAHEQAKYIAELEKKVAHAAAVLRLIEAHHGHAFSTALRDDLKRLRVEDYVSRKDYQALQAKYDGAVKEIDQRLQCELAAEAVVADLSAKLEAKDAEIAELRKEEVASSSTIERLRVSNGLLHERLELSQHNAGEAARIAGECEREEAAKVAAAWQPKGVGGTRAMEMAMAPRLIAEAIRARKGKV